MLVPENAPRDVRRAGAVTAARRILVGLILHAGNGAQHGDHFAAARREVGQLSGGQDGRMFGAVGLHLGGFRR